MRKTPLFLLMIFVIIGLFAVPANPTPSVVSFPDGSELLVYLRGDEYHSWHETDDGVDIIKNKDGVFEYVQVTTNGSIKASGIAAHAADRRTKAENNYISTMPTNIIYPEKMPRPDYTNRTEKMSIKSGTSDYEFEQTTFPTLGDNKFLVVLVAFADKNFRHTLNDFKNLMNGENYTYNGAVGSVRKYFNATSFDRFRPQFDVVGPVVLDNGYAYYGANDPDGETNLDLMKVFVEEAIVKADPLVDYSQYDNDNDGCVDNVVFIFAGYSEANADADENTIWPHQSHIASDLAPLDGKTFYSYSISAELEGTSGTVRTTIGVICHEFSHVLGLWDYYDTDYTGSGGNSYGLGCWDLMSRGASLDGGNRPPIHNAWSRMFLKWAEPVELLNPENVVINPASSSNEARYFHSPTSGEFFFLENRQQQDWDQGLYGHGLLIYHINKNYSGWSNNKINCDPARQGFDLEEAKGDLNPDPYYADYDPFPGRTTNRSFTDLTSPNATDWAGNYSNSPIINIQENDGVISFVFKNADVDTPENFEASAQGFNSIKLDWTLNAVADSVILLWSENEITAFPESMKKYHVNEMISDAKILYKGIDNTFNHTGLATGSMNYYAIYSFSDSAHIYSARTLKSLSTDSPLFFKTGFENGLPSGWVSYSCNGNEGFSSNNPLGRDITSTTESDGFLLIDSEHAGASDSINADLITQSYNFGLSQSIVVKFQHHLEVKNSTIACFSYSTNAGLSWNKLKVWTDCTENPEYFEMNLSNELSGLSDVQFKFSYTATNEKYWCIDDFQINSVVNAGLNAGFYASKVIGSKPLTVEFMNTTVSRPDSASAYLWEFGDDGKFYYEKNPTHIYMHSGVYNVILLATKGENNSRCYKAAYITVLNDAPVLIDNDIDTFDVKINQAQTYNLNEVFMDPNGDDISFVCLDPPTTVSCDIINDSLLVLEPSENYLGVESLTLVAIDNENDSLIHTVDIWVSETGIQGELPKTFALAQNYPNPFNPTTSISYQLPISSHVNFDIYNLKGQKVRTLVNEIQEAGYFTVNFNASDFSSGMYLYRLSAGNEVITKKMLLMK